MIIENIESNLNGFKCKYIYLDKLFNGKLDEKKGKSKLVDTANIYISLESLFNSFRSKSIEKKLHKMEKKEIRSVYRQIISNIINVAAHYRNYFSRHRVRTNIIFYYNEVLDHKEKYNNSALVEEYRDHQFESLNSLDRVNINNMVREAIPFLKIIIGYIENVYMIETRHVESSMVPFIFMMENYLPCNLNIIVTRDKYDFQYCRYNCLVITRHDTEAVLLTKKNIMKYWYFKNKIFDKDIRIVHYKLLTFILACSEDRKRSLENVHKVGPKTVIKQLLALYDAGYLLDEDPDTMNIESLMHVLNKKEFGILKNEDIVHQIISNYNVIDLEAQYRVINKTQKKAIEKQLHDKTDPGALVELNERYFADYPIQLVELNQYDK